MGNDEHGAGGPAHGGLSSARTVFAPAWGTGEREALQTATYRDRYETKGQLGEGGMGEVALCHDRQIGRNVAIKTILPQLRANASAEARFVREARIQGQLEHPAIVPVYDLGIDPEGSVYFSMKRVRGETLQEVLVGLCRGVQALEQRYSRHKLLTIFGSVCLAVHFAHQRSVLHRDLKPANIMLGDFGEVYVLDWGVARLPDSDVVLDASDEIIDAPLSASAATLPGTIIGTPGYMSPEQLVGVESELAAQSDIYSLGAILYEILTLQPLHDVSSLQEAVHNYATMGDPRLELEGSEHDVPPELVRICLRALQVDPQDRYESARELERAVDRFVQGERDVALRRQMAAQHAAEARTHARLAPTSIEARRQAMREIGRALALDPESEVAMDALVKLLTTPPDEVPPEVATQMSRSVRAQRRETAGIGMVVNLGLFAFLPLVLWVGLADPRPVVLLYGLAIICAFLSFVVSRQRRPGLTMTAVVMLLSFAMYACAWPLYGPLVLLPTILVANTTSFAIQFERWPRVLVIGAGVLTLLVPVTLEATGLVAPTYLFGPEGMLISKSALVLDSRTLLLLTLATVVAMVSAAVVVSRVRDALRDAERKLYLYTWHLREFIPEAARATTDPAGRRRSASVMNLGGAPYSAQLESDR